MRTPTTKRPWGVSSFAPIGQEAQHDGGAREGKEEAVEDRSGQIEAGGERDEGHRRRGQGDLQAAPEQREAPDVAEPPRGHLEADGEKEQDDAELGDGLDLIDRADQAEARWPDEGAGEQEARPGRQTQSREHDRDGQTDDEDEDQLPQKRPVLHEANVGAEREAARRVAGRTASETRWRALRALRRCALRWRCPVERPRWRRASRRRK